MTTLAGAWTELLARRRAFREALEPLGRIFQAWNAWPGGAVPPLECTAARARATWSDRRPLLVLAPPPLAPDLLEPALRSALDIVEGFEDARAFTAMWDGGRIGPPALLPVAGVPGAALVERCGLTPPAAAFLAVAGLRAPLDAWFAACRPLVDDGGWDGGMCPCCGALPACADLLEDGRRRLVCHLCDTRWTFSRLTCPLCGNQRTDDLVRLIADGADEGYAVTACGGCRGYVKEIDRRLRWNAGPALVEDWGSPHLDRVAHGRGYRRPIPTLVQLADSTAAAAPSPERP